MNPENDIFNKVIKGAQEVKLTEKERTALFSNVDSFLKKNPAIYPWFQPLFKRKSK